jgi:hypothetical protein
VIYGPLRRLGVLQGAPQGLMGTDSAEASMGPKGTAEVSQGAAGHPLALWGPRSSRQRSRFACRARL